jgi:hypothetical protein
MDLETPLPPWQPQTAKVMHPSHFLPESLVTGIWPEQRAQHTGWMVQNTRLFELFSCPIAQFTVVNNALTSIQRVFELVNNCRFCCFKYFRIRKLHVPILWKKIRIKELPIWLFQIPQSSRCERICKRTSGYKGGYLFFFPIFENHGYIWEPVRCFFENCGHFCEPLS